MERRKSARLSALQDDGSEQKGGHEQEGVGGSELCNQIEGFRTMWQTNSLNCSGTDVKGSGTDGFEQSKETDFYKDLREALGRQFRSSTSTAEEKVEELKLKLPATGMNEFHRLEPQERFFWMKTAFPTWNDSDVANIGASMAGIRSSLEYPSAKRQRSSSSSVLLSPREVGSCALQSSAVKDDLPTPVNDRADQIWPLECWMTDLSPGKSMAKMLERMKFTDCKFYLEDSGHVESVCGKGEKPDLLMVLKGHRPSSYSTGAIISLHSKGERSRFDNSDSVGEAIHYGRRFLREAGPMRCFIWVGITDLLDIIWFKVVQSDEVQPSCCKRSGAISKVRESLCAFLMADPCSLGMAVSLQKELGMPSDWILKRVLGAGRTSVVHEVEIERRSYALKVPKQDICLANDFAFLKVLAGFEGVPKIHSRLGKTLVLQPVGIPFSISTVKSSDLKFSLSQLVDILQAVHSKGVVNRDIRLENIMIAEGRLYILDWGFAAELGKAQPFAGCLYTTSDEVLAQITKAKTELIVYNAADDLVALIRCLLMAFQEDVADDLKCLGFESRQAYASTLQAFWCGKMLSYPLWQDVQSKAKDANYDAVKSWLTLSANFF